MPSPRAHRNGANAAAAAAVKGKVTEKSMSFHGRGTTAEKLSRPRTVPDLRSAAMNGFFPAAVAAEVRPKQPTKLLLNVTIQGSVGAVQVLMSPDLTVRDLISAALKQYVKEGRRPVLSSSSHGDFDLHYSQFNLESLGREEKIAALGSRNFFLCKRKVVPDGGGCITTSSCSKQAEKVTNKLGFPCPWLKFMSFLF